MYSTPEKYLSSVKLLNEKYIANDKAEQAAEAVKEGTTEILSLNRHI